MEKKKSVLSKSLVCGLLASLCCLLWGSVVPFLNVGYREFLIASGDTPTLILFAGTRFLMAGVLTILFACVQRRRFVCPKADNWGVTLKLCLVQTVLQYVLFYVGVANTPSVRASIIQGVLAFINILVACYIFRSERMNSLKWLGGALGVCGVLLVCVNGSGLGGAVTLMGEGALLASQVSNGLSAGLIKRYGKQEDSVTLSGWQFVLGGAIMMAIGYWLGGRLYPQSMTAIAVLLYLALVSSVAYTLWAVLLNHNPVSSVTVYTFLQPIFGVALAFVLGTADRSMSVMRCAAALLLVSASIVIVVRGQQEKK